MRKKFKMTPPHRGYTGNTISGGNMKRRKKKGVKYKRKEKRGKIKEKLNLNE